MPLPGDFFVTQIAGRTMAGRTHRWVQLGEWIIDGGDPSPWTHAGCVLDRGRILEAMPGGARYGWLSDLTGPVAYSSWPLTDTKRAELLAAARQYEGIGYSIADYAAIGLHDRAPDYDAAWLRQFIEDTRHQICSQVVDDWYTNCGLHPFADGRWPGYVKPSDLGRVLTGPQPIKTGNRDEQNP